MDYIVVDPVIVNGVHRRRGDELTGADAQAVEGNAMLRERCVPNPHTPPPAPAKSRAAASETKE